MSRSVVIAGLAAGVVLTGAVAAGAHRGGWYPGCNCGPVAPTTHYNTIHTSRAETRFHDVNVFKHVTRIHRVTNVTEVQPVIHVHEVTRVHHHAIVETRTAYRHVTEHLRPLFVVDHSVHNYYDCHCGW